MNDNIKRVHCITNMVNETGKNVVASIIAEMIGLFGYNSVIAGFRKGVSLYRNKIEDYGGTPVFGPIWEGKFLDAVSSDLDDHITNVNGYVNQFFTEPSDEPAPKVAKFFGRKSSPCGGHCKCKHGKP